MGQSWTPEELRQSIGAESPPVSIEVEKGHLRRFAQAIQDPNPLWQDEVAARATRYGGIVAPPTFLRALPVPMPKLELELPLSRLLDGGSAWEYFHPVRAGDTISAHCRLTDLRERRGRASPLVFMVLETIYVNQLGQVVAKQSSTMVRY
ncbi:MAG: MaoC family dehydratase N-terminal domain-containing protein [Chloroflexi bacterium]|nr:MaoC family dehydratase N-terminal domain-containing protein [Chloroflexota bacterium]